MIAALASCSSSTTTTPLPATLPPTVCAATAGDGTRTVRISVDDSNDSSGGLFAQVPATLTAGIVRLAVSAASGNAEAATLTVAAAGREVATIRGVAPGAACAIDVELTAGHYVVQGNGRSIAFDVAG